MPDKDFLNFILWELPFCQALAFWHCKKWESESLWTVSAIQSAGREANAQANRIVENIRHSDDGKEYDPDLSDG